MNILFFLFTLFFSVAHAEEKQFHFASGAYIIFHETERTFELFDPNGCATIYRENDYFSLMGGKIHELGGSADETSRASTFIIQSAIAEELQSQEEPTLTLGVETSEASFESLQQIIVARRFQGPLSLGELQQIIMTLESNNDNLLNGGARLLGLKKDSAFEGDDLGYTFGVALNGQADFENGSLRFNYRSDLYGRLLRTPRVAGDRSNYAADINVTVGDVRLRKDLHGRYFVDFDLGFATYEDQQGVALKMQSAYHLAARNSSVGGRIDTHTDHMQDFTEVTGAVAVGRNFTFYKNHQVEVTGSVAIGAEMRQRLNQAEGSGSRISPWVDARLDARLRQGMGMTVFATENTDSRELGADVFIPIVQTPVHSFQVYHGVSRFEPKGEFLKIYRDDELNYRLGFRYVRNLNAQ